jgi:hypothetical protein
MDNRCAGDSGDAHRGFISYTLSSTAVPEPTSWVLLVAGFVTVGMMARRRRMALVAA